MKSTHVDDIKVLVGTFVINFLLGGSSRLSPILFVVALTYYNADRQAASFPFVLSFIVRNFSGPLIGYLEQIFGMQQVVMTGGITATISIGACCFATDITTVTILWGVFFGLGLGMACTMLPVLLNNQFPNSRSKANGLYYAGSSTGTLVVPLLFQVSMNYYGLAGSYLLLCALMANCIPAGLLVKYSVKTSTAKRKLNQNISIIDSHKNSNQILINDLKLTDQTSGIATNHANVQNHIDDGGNHKRRNDTQLSSCSIENTYNTVCLTEISTVDTKVIESTPKKKSSLSFDKFSIFIDPSYIGILIIHALSTWVTVTFWTIIIDMVRDKGMEEGLETYFIICLPIAELMGRFICGYIIDKSFLTTSNMSFLFCIFISLSILMFNFVNELSSLLVFEASVSFFISGLMLLQVAFVHDFIEEDKRVMAMTCRLTLFAPCTLTVSPMIGYFRGTYGSYDIIIYIVSAVSFLCGCTTCCMPYLSRIRKK